MKKFFAALLLLSLLLTGCAAPAEELPAEQTPIVQEPESDNLVVHFIDVDQADCMLLIAGETTVLIDGGNTGTSTDVVSYLYRFGVDELDLLVNTHPHGDHLGGIPMVMEHFPVKQVWCSHASFSTSLFSQFKTEVTEQNLSIFCPNPGFTYEADGLSITVLGPLKENSHYEDLNDTSLVLMVQYGDRKFLFAGDMEKYAEEQLIRANTDLKADVLKVGHHGSYSSTSQNFLNRVDPDFGVICCGWQNEYGHPHGAPMNRLKNAKVELFRTDTMGNVVMVTDGETLGIFLEPINLNINGYDVAA